MEDEWENLIFPISDVEAEDIFAFLMDMYSNKIEYNYSDSRFLLPFLNCFDKNPIIQDVPHGTKPNKIKKVFCSQMICLTLRENLEKDGSNQKLREKLWDVNSRLISPGVLRNIVAEHSEVLSGDGLWEKLQHFACDASTAWFFAVFLQLCQKKIKM